MPIDVEARLQIHLSQRLGCDDGAFRQKKALFVASPDRDRPDPFGRRIPLWIFARHRARILSTVGPLVDTFRRHHAATLAGGDFLPPDLLEALAHDLAPFYGQPTIEPRTWYRPEPDFGHVQEIEILPLKATHAVDLDAFAPGWWERLAEAAREGLVLGVRMDGRFVAFAALLAATRTGGQIACATDPEYRGIGIGRELVAAVVGQALESGRTPALVTPRASPALGRIAKTLGLVEFGRDYVFEAGR